MAEIVSYFGNTAHPRCSEATGHVCQDPSGRICVDCDQPAGTHWGPMWCPDCDARRIDNISAGLASIATKFDELKR